MLSLYCLIRYGLFESWSFAGEYSINLLASPFKAIMATWKLAGSQMTSSLSLLIQSFSPDPTLCTWVIVAAGLWELSL